MSVKTKLQSDTELDHIRNTLTDVVSYASKTRSEMHLRFDQQDAELKLLKSEVHERFSSMDDRISGMDDRISDMNDRLSGVETALSQQQVTLNLILAKLA